MYNIAINLLVCFIGVNDHYKEGQEEQKSRQYFYEDIDYFRIFCVVVETFEAVGTNIVEKGIGTLLLEGQYKAAIKKYLGGVKFDLITYSTPPITFTNVVKYLKKHNPELHYTHLLN